MRREEPASGSASSAWLAGVFLLALAAGAGALVWQRRTGLGRWGGVRPATGTAIARLSSQALTPQASVHALRWHGEEILIACTAQQVTVIARQPADPGRGDGA